jgi:hypothetical protein
MYKKPTKEQIEITADTWPVDKTRIICLYSLQEFKKLKKGAIVTDVGGCDLEIGQFDVDLETSVFGRTKYGKTLK